MTLFAAPKLLTAQDPVKDPKVACAPENLDESAAVGRFVFKSYGEKNGGETCLQVFREGKVIFRRTNDNGGWYKIGQPANKPDHVPAIENGTDITGRGRSDMIVSFSTGGAHCCLMHYVFELQPDFKLLATLNAQDTWPAYFADLDRDHHYYYLAEDWAFAYWWESFAGSPFHSVVLRYVDDSNGGAFHLAIDKMQTPAPSPKEWQKALRIVRQELRLEQENMANNLPNVLWQEVIDLIYTGHSDLAWKFLDEVGPRAQQSPFPDLATFCLTLKTSSYWPDLAPTLKNTPPACAHAQPHSPKLTRP